MNNAEPKTVVFTAQSKVYFYCRDAVCEYVFRSGAIPVNPFRVFEYFLGDRVERNWVRTGNNNLIRICDELWVFGPIADGVLAEIVYARGLGKRCRFFTIDTKSDRIRELVLPRDSGKIVFERKVRSPRRKREELLSLILLGYDDSPQLRLFD